MMNCVAYADGPVRPGSFFVRPVTSLRQSPLHHPTMSIEFRTAMETSVAAADIDTRIQELSSYKCKEEFQRQAIAACKDINHDFLAHAGSAQDKIADIVQVAKDNGAFDAKFYKQLQIATKAVRSHQNAVAYKRRKDATASDLARPSEVIESLKKHLGQNALKVLSELDKQYGATVADLLLRRALLERFWSKLVPLLQTPLNSSLMSAVARVWQTFDRRIKLTDIRKARHVAWEFEEPPEDILTLVEKDEADMPLLSSTWLDSLPKVHPQLLPKTLTPSRLLSTNADPPAPSNPATTVHSEKSTRKRSQPDDKQCAAPGLSIDASKLGENTMAVISHFQSQQNPAEREAGYMVISVTNLPPTTAPKDGAKGVDKGGFLQKNISFQSRKRSKTVQYRVEGLGKGEQWSVRYLDDSEAAVSKDSWEEWMQQQLQQQLRERKRNLQYFVIELPRDQPAWFDTILRPGSVLAQLPRLPGINTAYRYISNQANTPTGLHIEDANLASLNLLVAGHPKIWLMVQPSYQRQLEDFVIKELQIRANTYCAQFVRLAEPE